MVLGCGVCLARGSAPALALYRTQNPIIEEIIRSTSHSGDLRVLTPLNPKPLMVEQRRVRGVYRFNLTPCMALFSPIRAPLRVHWTDIRVVNTTGYCLKGRTSGPLSGGYVCQIYDSGDSVGVLVQA